MSRYTLRELVDKLVEVAGAPEGIDLDGDIADVPFMELDYDSLAIIQVTNVIGRELGIRISEDAAAEAECPRLLLKMINESPLVDAGE
jgi:act minimal PKS acyl carrier protein